MYRLSPRNKNYHYAKEIDCKNSVKRASQDHTTKKPVQTEAHIFCIYFLLLCPLNILVADTPSHYWRFPMVQLILSILDLFFIDICYEEIEGGENTPL